MTTNNIDSPPDKKNSTSAHADSDSPTSVVFNAAASTTTPVDIEALIRVIDERQATRDQSKFLTWFCYILTTIFVVAAAIVAIIVFSGEKTQGELELFVGTNWPWLVAIGVIGVFYNLFKQLDHIDKNFENLGKKIENLGQKIENIGQKMDKKIENIGQNLDKKMDEVKDLFKSNQRENDLMAQVLTTNNYGATESAK